MQGNLTSLGKGSFGSALSTCLVVISVVVFFCLSNGFFQFGMPEGVSANSTKRSPLLVANLLVFLLVYIFLRCYSGSAKKLSPNKGWVNLLSGLITLFIIIGYCFYQFGSIFYVSFSAYNYIFLSILFLGFFLLFQTLVFYLFFYATCIGSFFSPRAINKCTHFTISVVDLKTFFLTAFLLLVFWSPYIVLFYPGLLSFDPNLAIRQFFGLESGNAMGVVLIDPKVPITNHHPYLHTLLLGYCISLGLSWGSFNSGLFLYTICQVFAMVFSFSLAITYLKKLGLSKGWTATLIGFYAFVPIFPYYAMTIYKDVFYASFFLIFVVLVHFTMQLYLRGQNDLPWLVGAMITTFGVFLSFFRHNGIFVVLPVVAFLILLAPLYRRKLIIIFCIILSAFVAFNYYYLPYAKISPAPSREKYSLPFQQTARYVKHFPEVVSALEKQYISVVLPFDDLSNIYDPNLSDPVKSTYNFLATPSQFRDYLKAWASGFIKKPLVYVEATLHNIYLYFYPFYVDWVVISKPDLFLRQKGFDYSPLYASTTFARDVVSFTKSFIYIPVLGLLVNGAFVVWLILGMFMCSIVRNSSYNLCLLTPYLITILFFIVSPANGHFRYFLPLIYSYPLLVFLFSFNLKYFPQADFKLSETLCKSEGLISQERKS